MFCNNCGNKLEDNVKFCMNCGNPVVSAPTAAPQMAAPQFASAPDLDAPANPKRTPAPTPVQNPGPIPVYSAPRAAKPGHTPEREYRPTPQPVYAEPPRREAPSAPAGRYAAPAAPKKKKSGVSPVLILVLLLIAAVVGVAVWGFVDGWLPDLFSGEQSGKDSGEKEEEEDPYADWEEYKLKGLTFYLPEEFDKEDEDSEFMEFESKDLTVLVWCYWLEDYEEDISDAEEFAKVLASKTDVASDVSVETSDGENNGVYYKLTIYDEEEYFVNGYYVGSDRAWVISVQGEDVDSTEDMIEYATTGKVKKSSDNGSTSKDDDDADAPVTEKPTESPDSRYMYVECNGMRFRLDDSFEESYSDDTYAYYYNDVMNIEISSGDMADVGEGIDSSREFAEFYVSYMEVDAEYGKRNGITYIVIQEEGYSSADVYGFYVEDDTGWYIHISASDFHEFEDQILDIATGGELE